MSDMITDLKLKEGVMGMMQDPKLNLTTGFQIAYRSLVKAVAEKDYTFIEQVCEHHLSETLFDRINHVAVHDYDIESLNDDSEDIDLEPLEINLTLGASVDRS